MSNVPAAAPGTAFPIADLLAGEHVEARVAELVAESGIETHPERL